MTTDPPARVTTTPGRPGPAPLTERWLLDPAATAADMLGGQRPGTTDHAPAAAPAGTVHLPLYVHPPLDSVSVQGWGDHPVLVGELAIPVGAALPDGYDSASAKNTAVPLDTRVVGHVELVLHPAVVPAADVVTRDEYDFACQTIAAMHAAAVGEVRGPIRGVVEDVADLRARCQAAEDDLDRAQVDAHREQERANRAEAKLGAALRAQPVTGPGCAETTAGLLREAAALIAAGEPDRGGVLIAVADAWRDLGVAVATHQALTRPDSAAAGEQ